MGKNFIWLGMIVGTTVGGCVPTLWGDNFLSLTSILLTVVGGFVGIYLGYKLQEWLEG
jgi:uncharacterized membrane protein YeaQ/YmgE (transglycosylase-associated protein family)